MIDLSKLNAEDREAVIARRAYQKAWREKNRDKVKANNARFYKKHAEKAKEKPSE